MLPVCVYSSGFPERAIAHRLSRSPWAGTGPGPATVRVPPATAIAPPVANPPPASPESAPEQMTMEENDLCPWDLRFVIGFLTVLLAAFCFSFQNVIVRVLFSTHNLLGGWPLGGFVTPTWPHSFLLLLMRMTWVVPLMALLAPKLYPATWTELRQLRQADHRPLLIQAIAAGSLMFLYLALLYIAIGLIPTGVALTLFFTYPVFTALLSWKLFGSSPTRVGWGVMGCVFLGSLLTLPPPTETIDPNNVIGIVMGIASGLAYAGYTVLAQKSFTQLHPVPFTWLSFAVTWLWSAVSFGLWAQPNEHLPWLELWIGGALSAIATASGHLLNNYGVRLIGATTAAMVAAANPAFTVVLAWITLQETLSLIQVAGVLLVTGSIVVGKTLKF